MRYGFRKAMIAGAGLCGLLAGCATSVDMGGPLGHYRYSYDSRPVIHDDDAGVPAYHRYTYEDRYSYDEPGTGVTIYHHDDDDD